MDISVWLMIGFLLPIYTQASLLSADKEWAHLLRKALIPIGCYFAHLHATQNSFGEDLTYLPINLAVVAIFGFYGILRSIELGVCDPVDYQPVPPSNKFSPIQAMAYMRGIGMKWSQRVKLPPTSSTTSSQCFWTAIRSVVVYHVAILVAAAPLTQTAPAPYNGSGRAYLKAHAPDLYYRDQVADVGMSLSLGVTAWLAMEMGNQIFAALAFGLQEACLSLGLWKQPSFEPDNWRPLFNSPLMVSSVQDFWSTRWHALFHRPFTVLAFKPARRLGTRIGGKSVGYALGVLAVFLLSGAMHEYGMWAARKDQPTWDSTKFFVLSGVAIIGEGYFKRVTGRKVSGVLGRIWAFSFLLYTATRYFAKDWLDRGLNHGTLPYQDYSPARFLIPFAPILPAKFLGRNE